MASMQSSMEYLILQDGKRFAKTCSRTQGALHNDSFVLTHIFRTGQLQCATPAYELVRFALRHR